MNTFHIYNVGQVSFPENFRNFFDIDYRFIISQAYGKNYHFETDAEPLYDMICQMEEESGESLYEYKRKIVDALLDRKKECKGFYIHKGFRGDDTQLRSTSAIIRTLVSASNDFSIDDEVKEIVKQHFSYYFNWGNGIWLCHDTSEYMHVLAKGVISSKVWQKDAANTITLNTHVDSLSTLLYVLKYKPEYKDDFLDIANKSIVSINQLLFFNEQKCLLKKIIQIIDYPIFKLELKRFLKGKSRLFITKVYDFVILNNIVKRFFPFIFYKNGFIGRDIAITNRHFDYHIINMLDILRLCAIYSEIRSRYSIEYLNMEQLLLRVEKGLNFINANPDFKNYIQRDFSEDAALQECAELFHLLTGKKYRYIFLFEDVKYVKSKFIF